MAFPGSRRDFLKTAGGGAGMLLAGTAGALPAPQGTGVIPASKGSYVGGLKTKPLKTVRMAFIGTGARGPTHINSALKCEGVEIVAICDTHEPSRKKGIAKVVNAGRPAPAGYGEKGEYDYRRMLERDDIDAVVISTPWRWHGPMLIDAMNAGKHAFTEVPMSYTLEETWNIIDTAERTQKHCMMMENVNYGREELMVLNMCRQGLFGELLHGEAAYIHELRGQMKALQHGTGFWRTLQHTKRDGNLYPTHGLGPVAQYMNIDRGEDRFEYLSSVSSQARGRQLYAQKTWPADHPRNQLKYVCGDMNTSLIKTQLGRSLMVQHDTTSPRPYSRHNLIQGTKGTFAGFPNRIVVEGRGGTHGWTQGDGLKPFYEEFDHPLFRKQGALAKKVGGHGGMDFLMMWRIIYCLRNGEPLDQNVYEGASWSAVGPLSEISVAHNGTSVKFPDFTRGKWKDTEPLGIFTLE